MKTIRNQLTMFSHSYYNKTDSYLLEESDNCNISSYKNNPSADILCYCLKLVVKDIPPLVSMLAYVHKPVI